MTVQRKDFTIANGATESDFVRVPGARLVGLILPTLTSTTVTFETASDGATTDGVVNSNTPGAAPAALTLGNANVGAIVQAVPEAVGALSAVIPIRLKVAAQGAARTVTGLFERVAS